MILKLGKYYFGGKSYIAFKKYLFLPIVNEELEWIEDTVRQELIANQVINDILTANILFSNYDEYSVYAVLIYYIKNLTIGMQQKELDNLNIFKYLPKHVYKVEAHNYWT